METMLFLRGKNKNQKLCSRLREHVMKLYQWNLSESVLQIMSIQKPAKSQNLTALFTMTKRLFLPAISVKRCAAKSVKSTIKVIPWHFLRTTLFIITTKMLTKLILKLYKKTHKFSCRCPKMNNNHQILNYIWLMLPLRKIAFR